MPAVHLFNVLYTCRYMKFIKLFDLIRKTLVLLLSIIRKITLEYMLCLSEFHNIRIIVFFLFDNEFCSHAEINRE